MRVIPCPACQASGSVPDTFPGGRIKCPRCGCRFEVPGPGTPKAATAKTLAPVAKQPPAPPKPVAAPASVFDGLDEVDEEVVHPVARIGAPARTPARQEATVRSPLIYVGIGAGVLVGCLGLFLVVNAMRGPATGPAQKTELAQNNPEPARSDPASIPIDPVPVPPQLPDPAPVVDHATVVQRLKKATVYIKIKINGKLYSSGSGFAIEIKGDKALIATNRHVVIPDLSELPDEVTRSNFTIEREVVLNSGEPGAEQTLAGTLLAADESDDLNRDLAFLMVPGLKQPPIPLALAQAKVPQEGTTYLAAGFPGGPLPSMLIGNKGNPSITITTGLISSMRRDQYGQLHVIQVNGALNHGNSGGPLVESTTGALLGVAVAKLSSEASESTGFSIPAEQVTKALEGRVGNCRLTQLTPPSATTDLEVRADLVDPRGRVREVMFFAAPASSVGNFGPDAKGVWSAIPNAKPIPLAIDPQTREATGRFQVSLSGQGDEARKVVFQAAHKDETGRIVYDRPITQELLDRPGVIGSDLEKVIKALRRRSFTKLGPLVDPDESCSMNKDTNKFKVTIHVPGKKVFSMSPEMQGKGSKPVHNAPRSLVEVNGDFAVVVRVAGDLNPGVETIKDPKGIRNVPITFQGAGLLLYQDKDNFMRVERSSRTQPGGATLIEELTIEVVREGKQAVRPIYLPVPEGDMSIIMVRRKGQVRCLVSPDNKMLIATKPLAFDWPDKVSVGLCVSNISRKPFDAQFEDFVIVDDKTTLDQEFGDETP